MTRIRKAACTDQVEEGVALTINDMSENRTVASEPPLTYTFIKERFIALTT